jgi:predicted DNA-binding transcriptional regulator AlpA
LTRPPAAAFGARPFGLKETTHVADLPPERLLTRRQTAELIGTSERTLRRWDQEHRGPPALRFSERMIRYNIDAVRAWLEFVNARGARREKLYFEKEAR